MSAGFSGVGKVNAFDRLVSGAQGVGRFLGNCPGFKISLTPDSVERNSSMDTSRGALRRMTRATAGGVEIVCDEYSKPNWALWLFGRIDSVAAGAVVATTPFAGGATTAVVGSVLAMPDKNVTALVITDSTGVAKTLTAGVNYDPDTFNGTITILDLTTGGPFVQPLKYGYTKGAVDIISGLVVPDKEVWLNLAGTNADTGERGTLDAYRVRLSPAENLDLINNDYLDVTVKGSILQDSTKTAAGVGGNYFKWAVPTTIA